MSLRDDLIPVVDGLRRDVVDAIAGLRLVTVVVRRRIWLSGRIGVGAYTDTDLTLDPVPKISDVDPRLIEGPGGKFEAGDRIANRVSLTYSRADLGDGPRAPNVDLFWLLDDKPYQMIAVSERFLGWSVQLRAMRGRP